MLDDIDKWVGIAGVAATGLWGYFKVVAKVDALEKKQVEEIKRVDAAEDDIDTLKEEKTRVSTVLTGMSEMQQETRLDVKMILQQLATLAANQNKRPDTE